MEGQSPQPEKSTVSADAAEILEKFRNDPKLGVDAVSAPTYDTVIETIAELDEYLSLPPDTRRAKFGHTLISLTDGARSVVRQRNETDYEQVMRHVGLDVNMPPSEVRAHYAAAWNKWT